ncbi:MAG: MBL fold metallo-hydrolase, partial [Acidobacteriota bacterium]
MSFTWHRGGLSIQGSSAAGDRSWFRIHPPGLAFDVGRGAPELAGSGDIFLTHGHLDHALGLPYVLSQHSVHEQAPTRIFCPAEVAADVREFLAASARLERVEYRYDLRGLVAGERVPVSADLAVEPFAVDHVVPALGYHLIRRRRRLLAALAGTPAPELARRRRENEPVDEPYDQLWLSYCGDTSAAVFELEPRVFASQTLLLECTFMDPKKRPSAGRYKHIHVEDLLAVGDRFANEAILLCHLSRRHRASELRHWIAAHLPALAERVTVLSDEPE